jgi:hypothetical protein
MVETSKFMVETNLNFMVETSKFMVETNFDRSKRKKKWVGVEFIVVVVVVVVRTYIIVLCLA